MHSKKYISGLVILAAIAPALVRADEIHWASAVSGNWNDTTKWTGGVVPGASDTAVIDPAGTYTVTLNVNATVAGLTLGGTTGTQTISMTGRTLTLNGASTITGQAVANIASSTVNGTGSLSNAGTMTLSGGDTFNVPLTNNGSLTVLGQNLPADATLNGSFANHGTLAVSAQLGCCNLGARLLVANSFDNDGLISINSSVGGELDAVLSLATGVLTNLPAGIIRAQSESGWPASAIDARVLNQGEIQAIDGELNITNAGRVFDSTQGTLNIGATRALHVNNGETRLGTDTVLLGTGSIDLTGTHALKLDSPFVHPAVGAGPQPVFSGVVTVSELMPATASYTLNGNLTLFGGDTFNVPLTNNGSLTVLGQNLPADATLNGSFANHGTLAVSAQLGCCNLGARLLVANSFDNDGLISINSSVGGELDAVLSLATGVLTNLPAGIIRAQSESGWPASAIDARVLNQGEIQVIDGELNITNSINGISVNNGVINIASGRTLRIANGSLQFNSGTAQGDGTLVLTNVNFSGNGNALIQISANAGTSIAAMGGTLAMGKSTSASGFSTGGSVSTGSEALTLHDSNSPTIGGLVSLTGGMLIVPNGYTHTSTISGFGTMQANLTNNGTITVGSSPGILNVVGNYTQGSGGILNMELGGLVVGTEYDRLAQSQNGPPASATLGGTLNISRIGLYVPVAGNVFTILTASARVGTFATVNGLNMPCTTTLAITYHPTEVRLTTSGGCNDSNACTSNVCNPGPGTCSFPANYNTATDCCNPANGSVTTITDDNVCTADSCNSSNGVVTYTDLTPPGFCCAPPTGQLTPIDDEVSCTDDQCNLDGSVDHFDNCVTGLHCDTATSQCVECLQDADCPADQPFCDLSDNDCNECLDDSVCPESLYCELDRGFCVPLPLEPDGLGEKCRFISFQVPAENAAQTALRVRLISLHHVNPPYTGGPSIPFTSFEGQVRWVGPPESYIESTANPTPFLASSLQCTPHYRDWTSLGMLHVTGSPITPSSFYDVENVAALCMGLEVGCTAISNPLRIGTTRWGDVEIPYNPPSTTVQPDLGDISALVNKFRSAPGAPIKARALLAGDDAFGNISTAILNVDFSFAHISACVDAFRGKPYPFTIQACP